MFWPDTKPWECTIHRTGFWFVRSIRIPPAGAILGCLLLTEHPAEKNWELIYFGVVPEARGSGQGLEIVRQAQWLTGQSSAERLVLAVDAANSPAIAVYAAAGFEAWDRRSVFLRKA